MRIMEWFRDRCHKSAVFCYASGLFSLTFFIALQSVIYPLVNRTPFALLMLSTTLTAWISGRRAAIVMSILGIPIVDYIFIEPTERNWYTHVLGVLLVSCITAVMIYIITSMDKAIKSSTTEIARRKQLQEQQKVFIAILGHDLRNPVSAVKMSAQSLIATETKDSTQATAARIMRVTDRLARLIDHLLDYSRADVTGQFPIYREHIKMKNVLDDVINQVSLAAAEDKNRITCICSDDTEGNWDPDRLCQMIQNLLANALDHGDPDKAIEVRASKTGGAVCVVISNKILGSLPHEKLGTLFKPFGSSGRKRTGARSTGLGLFIARQVVLAHGGSIKAEISGDAMTFTIILPCDAQQSSVSPNS